MIAAAALYVHLAEPAAQVNDPRLSLVPSLSGFTAAAPAVSFPFEPVAQVDEPTPSFTPSAASVDSAAVSVAAAPSMLPVPLVSVITAAASVLYRKTRFIGATNVQKIPFLTILIDGDNFGLDKLCLLCDAPKQSEEGKLPVMSYQYCPETFRFRNICISKIRWHLYIGGTYKPGFTV